MQKNWKSFGIFAVACSLLGCTPLPDEGAPAQGGGQAEQAKADSSGKAGNKLTLWVFAEPHKRFYEEVKKEFAKTKPDVEVEINLMETKSEMDKYAIISKSGGEGAPDLLDIEQGQFPLLIRGDVPFEPLDDYLKRDNLNDVMSKGRQALYTVNGKQYGIEHAATVSALYYRKDLFDQAGIKVEELKTWDQFTEQAKKLTGKNKYIFPAASNGTGENDRTYFELLIKQEGGDIVTTSGEVGLRTPEALTALKRTYDWKNSGIMDKEFISGPAYWDAFKTGKYIAAFGPDWWVNLLADNVPDLSGKWAAVPMPTGGPKSVSTSVWGGTGLMISKFSKNKELAWEFLKTAQLTPAMSVKRFQIVNLFPALIPSLNDPGLHEQSTYTKYFGGQDLGELYGKLVPIAPNQNQAWWRTQFKTAWDKYSFDYQEGKLTPEQMLEKVDTELKALIKKEEAVSK